MRPVTSRVAARLREERQRQGVSLESLAAAARVSPNAIIRFETGKTSIQLDTLTRLVVRGLGLDWAAFMASTGAAGQAADVRIDPRAALYLSRGEATQLRRWLVAVARLIRRARRRNAGTDNGHGRMACFWIHARTKIADRKRESHSMGTGLTWRVDSVRVHELVTDSRERRLNWLQTRYGTREARRRSSSKIRSRLTRTTVGAGATSRNTTMFVPLTPGTPDGNTMP